MNIEELKMKCFFSDSDSKHFQKDMMSLDVIELKKMAVYLNDLAEEKRRKINGDLSENMKKYLKYIEAFKDIDYTLIFDKLESIKYDKPCTIKKDLPIFSSKARFIFEIIDTLNEQELEELRTILYDNYEYCIQDKKLSRVYRNTILRQYNE